MSHLHHVHHVVEVIDKMPRLPKKKSPVVAGLLGFAFGAIGIGLYFQRWTDFLVCIGVFILLAILIPGVGAVPGWWFAAGYGVYRAVTSNQKHPHVG